MITNPLLIIGLGNPGLEYKFHRHNIGFLILDYLAQKNSVSFVTNKNLLAKVAPLLINERKVYLIKPTTFMNHSGRAVSAARKYYKVPLEDLLVISDDLYLPFGQLRLRHQGSAGGHNGLKSIIQSCESQEFSRLKFGIDLPDRQPIEDYVLSNFSTQETLELDTLFPKAIYTIEQWITSKNAPLPHIEK